YLKIILIFLLYSSKLTAYQDYDIDGVEDAIDRCPNTPFDKLVDKWGCPKNDTYYGSITFKIGSDINIDQDNEQLNNLNFYLNYRYYKWDFSISNANYTVLDTPSNIFKETGDIYMTAGYSINSDSLSSKIYVGAKVSTSRIDEENDTYMGTGEDDYFAALNLNYFLNTKQNIFLYYGYTISGDSSYVDYKNTNTYSFGSGYALNERWYSALSYEYSSSAYEDTDAYKAVSWFNSYSFSKNYFATINYAYALNDMSYDHAISIKLGVYFE
ncbi:MAG: hypothetical protein U9N33_05820, partial [Campylobacterota bacterium]|nr:hypothetical protein [Campylobacterota bacterium]